MAVATGMAVAGRVAVLVDTVTAADGTTNTSEVFSIRRSVRRVENCGGLHIHRICHPSPDGKVVEVCRNGTTSKVSKGEISRASLGKASFGSAGLILATEE